ncbi:MAG: DUF1569 domain-containing protein [Flavisolibacter sp.]|nr:DUF1569 domain-containing protein [Flavisolibacter sp.]
MKKNIFDKHTADEIIARAQSLQPNSRRKWGTMEVTEMLHHCNRINKMNMEGGPDGKSSSLKQQLLRILVLHITQRIPKNIKGANNHQDSVIIADAFDSEKEKFCKTIKEFSERTTPIQVTHPVFGKLTTKEWGEFTWMHMDHHLRQFGV